MSKAYWKSLPERDGDTAFLAAAENEFPEELSGIEGVSRRSWLRAAGFVFGGALLAGCRQAATKKAIPYLVKPEEITPGRASWYASTCAGCAASCGILIRARDGRPIKLEGNPEHPMSRGGLCAVGQASILGLYDSARLQRPLAGGKPAKWEEVDREIAAKLEAIRNSGGAVRFLSTTVTSPTLRGAIEHFLSGFRDGRHVVYDPLSCSAILDAHERTHGA